MYSNYNDLVKSYKEQKQKEIKASHSREDGNINSESDFDFDENKSNISNESISGQYRVQDLENQFKDSLKISKLSGVEKTKLITTFHLILDKHKSKIDKLQTSCNESKELCSSYKDLVKRLDKENKAWEEKYQKKSIEIEESNSKCALLHIDIKGWQEQCQKIKHDLKEENLHLKQNNKKEMEEFLSRMDIEVESAKLSMKQETSKMLEDAKRKSEREKENKIQFFKNNIVQLQEQNDSMRHRYDAERLELIEAKEAIETISKKERERQSDLIERLSASDDTLKRQEEQILVLKQQMETDKLWWQERKDRDTKGREKELARIENIVKHIIQVKDSKINELAKEMEEVQAREKKLKSFIHKIEKGLPDV